MFTLSHAQLVTNHSLLLSCPEESSHKPKTEMIQLVNGQAHPALPHLPFCLCSHCSGPSLPDCEETSYLPCSFSSLFEAQSGWSYSTMLSMAHFQAGPSVNVFTHTHTPQLLEFLLPPLTTGPVRADPPFCMLLLASLHLLLLALLLGGSTV
jgi:hypothetical protein